MAASSTFTGISAWLQAQWSNPGDICTILLIIGGDIIQVSIAQLSAGPIPYLVPVSFSFGWVTYAVSALRSAVGENRLMPKPELACMLINAETGYSRANHSWVLSRMLRDFDVWRPNVLSQTKKVEEKLSGDVRIALRVTVWQCRSATGKGSGDIVYWIGLFVSATQLGLAAVPWMLYDEWYTFLVTAAGTLLAYASGALPQWTDEKVRVRRLSQEKIVFLTEGNGAADVLMIVGAKGDLDLEALAAPQRELRSPRATRILSTALAICWVAFLVTVAGWEHHTWYLIGVGIFGILHNVTVAGVKRQPKAWGIDLQYRETIVDSKVMGVLYKLEQSYPGAGHALVAEFFPAQLFPREERLWNYAKRRHYAWKTEKRPVTPNGVAVAWAMPPLHRVGSILIDDDIPESGQYVSASDQLSSRSCPSTGDAIIEISPDTK